MATANNPGVGQGKGGGRPKRGDVVPVQVRLSREAAFVLETHAEAVGLPVWRVVEDLIRIGLIGNPAPTPPLPLPSIALELAKDASLFMEAHRDDPQLAIRALRRAWTQALHMVSHELTNRRSTVLHE